MFENMDGKKGEKTEGGEVIYCSQEKMVHSLNHRSNQKVFSASKSQNKFTKVFENLKSWLKIGFFSPIDIFLIIFLISF